MSEKRFVKRNLSATNPVSNGEIDTAVSNNVLPLTVSVYIDQNPIGDDLENIANENEISLRAISSANCDRISITHGIESCSTVFSSNSSINDDSNHYKLNARGMTMTSVNPLFGQSSGLCVPSAPSNYTVHIGSIENCPEFVIGDQQIYNGTVTINQFVANCPDKNHENWKWTKKTATSGKIVTYLVVLLLISIIIILINNISSLIPTPQIFHQNTADQSEAISSSENKGFENFTTKAHNNLVEVHWNCRNEKFFATYATTIVLLLLANFLIYFFMKRCKKFVSDCGDSGSDAIVSDATVHVVLRTEWLAKPPKEKLTPLVLPSTTVIIAHTDTNRGSTKEMLSLQCRHIQLKHMDERGWDDIGYNFLVGGDGAIYVGRGWNQQGAHSRGFNAKSICIAFIGRFNITEPPDCQLIAAQKLIQEGVKLNKLTKDYRLYGHRQLRPFDSPGEVLYRIIQKWEHWTEEVLNP